MNLLGVGHVSRETIGVTVAKTRFVDDDDVSRETSEQDRVTDDRRCFT